jgi:serine/threonine protein kinase
MTTPSEGQQILARLVSDFRDYIKQVSDSELGHGSYGVVYPGLRRQHSGNQREWGDLPVAMKFFNSIGLRRDQVENSFVHELEYMLRARHLACLPIVAWGFPSGRFVLVTPRMETDLQKLLDACRADPKRFPYEGRSLIALGIASGIAHLHSLGIIHCDIKPGNILLERKSDGEVRPMIGDFGLAKQMKRENLTGAEGTPIYQAPEWLAGDKELRPSIDVYSYGVLLFELFTGVDANTEKFRTDGITGFRPEFPASLKLPPPLVGLIQTCWAQDRTARPTFQQILEQRETLKVGGGDFANFEKYWEELDGPYTGTNYWPPKPTSKAQ